MRIVLGVVAGLVLAVFCVFAIETVGHTVYPPPADIDATDPADLARLMEVMPVAALLFVIGGWFVGALVGAWTANAIARNPVAGWVVALCIILGAVATMVMIPHPAWMWAAGIGLPLLAGWIAARMTRVAA